MTVFMGAPKKSLQPTSTGPSTLPDNLPSYVYPSFLHEDYFRFFLSPPSLSADDFNFPTKSLNSLLSASILSFGFKLTVISTNPVLRLPVAMREFSAIQAEAGTSWGALSPTPFHLLSKDLTGRVPLLGLSLSL